MARCCPTLLIAMCLAGCSTAYTATENPVADRYWGLREFQNVKVGQSGMELATVRFRTDGGIDGTAICNSVSTGLAWSPAEVGKRGRIVNAANRALVKTAVGCGDAGANNVADNFWKQMESSEQWRLQGQELQIVFRDGSTAELISVPTPASEDRPGCAESDRNNLDCRG